MKENDGRAARRQSTQKLLTGVGLAAVALLLLMVLGRRGGDETTRSNGARLLRDTSNYQKIKQLHRSHHNSDEDDAQVMKQVLAGDLQLMDMTVKEQELIRAPPNSYAGVYGKFCKLDWSRRKRDPSAGAWGKIVEYKCTICSSRFRRAEQVYIQISPSTFVLAVPMFRHLVEGSSECEQPYVLNIRQVVDLARHQDEVNGATSTSSTTPKVLNFTMATFHESRCGSTLVANAVAAMDSTKHRSYSEAGPPAFAMNSVCGKNFSRCTLEQAAQVLKDVIYLMSRSNDALEERVFFKFQSATTKNIQVFQKAFPEIPWLFVYRDPVQVMMSHIKDDPDLKGRANCLRSHRSPPDEIISTAAGHGVKVKNLKMEEYCAVHLAAITESAVASLNDIGIPVNYESLPDILHTTILPRILGRTLTEEEVSNIQKISQNYSKGVGHKHQEFKADSEAKEKAASTEIKAAATKFLQPSFESLSQHRPRILD